MSTIDTTLGPMDEALLEKRTPTQKTSTGTAHLTEYWLDGVLVHRSIHFVFDKDYVPRMGGDASLGGR